MYTLVVICYLILAAYYLGYFTRGRRLLNPGALFVFSQLVVFTGTLSLTEPGIVADEAYLVVMLIGLLTFVMGSVIVSLLMPISRSKVKQWWASEQKVENQELFNSKLYGLLIVCILISSVYYYFVGRILFIEAFLSLISGQGQLDDVAGMRLDAYAGDRYLAPGYVNQFKNVLLPLLLAFLGARYILLKRKSDLWTALFLSPFSLIFLVGTGQRAAFFWVFCILSIFFWGVLPRKSGRRANILLMMGAVLLLSILTVILGRVSQDANPLSSLFERIFHDNQISGVVAFRYLYDLPTCWGSEWGERLVGLLPGYRGSTLDNDIFSIMYVSRRGTSPPTIWGSAWYNFGYIGVIVFGFSLGTIYQLIYRRLLSKPRTLFRQLIYAAFTIILGLWLAGGPDTLANTGLVTICMLKFLLTISTRRFSGNALWRRNGNLSSSAPTLYYEMPPETTPSA